MQDLWESLVWQLWACFDFDPRLLGHQSDEGVELGLCGEKKGFLSLFFWF